MVASFLETMPTTMTAAAQLVVATGAVVAVVAGWRPSNRAAAALATLPLASVSIMAGRSRNPFDALVFAMLAVVLVVLATARGDDRRVSAGPNWARGRSPLRYLFAAPLGILPCPTLATVSGVALMARRFGNRGWTSVLAVAAMFYAVSGIARLGVFLDAGLLGGAVSLAIAASLDQRRIKTAAMRSLS